MKPLHNEHLFIEYIKSGYFHIDNKGKIWRIAIRHWSKPLIKIPKREMKTLLTTGYILIQFTHKGKIHHCLAHRVVWTYFNGTILDDKQINHINGIKTDNRPENLELLTCSENHKHAFRIGLRYNKGENNPQSKLKENDIKQIRQRYLNGEFQISIAKYFDISQPHISEIISKRYWSHIE